MNKSGGSRTKPVRIQDTSTGKPRLSTMCNQGDSCGRKLQPLKIYELLPQFYDSATKSEPSCNGMSRSTGKASGKKNQPVRIAATADTGSIHKTDVASRRKPVRIVHNVDQIPKLNVRRRLDEDYDPPKLLAKENINPVLMKRHERNDAVVNNRFTMDIPVINKVSNTENLANTKDEGGKRGRKSFLLPPNTIRNRYTRNSVTANTFCPHPMKPTLPNCHSQSTKQPDIVEESPQHLDSSRNSLEDFDKHLAQTGPPSHMEQSIGKSEVSVPDLAKIPTCSVTDDVGMDLSSPLCEAIAEPSNMQSPQFENIKRMADYVSPNKSSFEGNNEMNDVDELQRPTVIVGPKETKSMIIEYHSPIRSLLKTPTSLKSFSPMECSTHQRGRLYQPISIPEILLSPFPRANSKSCLLDYAGNILDVQNVGRLKDLCVSLQNADISESHNQHQNVHSENLGGESQAEVNINMQNLLALERNLKESIYTHEQQLSSMKQMLDLVRNMLRPNGMQKSGTNLREKDNALEVKLPANSQSNKRKEDDLDKKGSRCNAVEEEKIDEMVEIVSSPKVRKKRSKSMKNEDSLGKMSQETAEPLDNFKLPTGKNEESRGSEKKDVGTRRRSARLAAKMIQSPVATDDSFQMLENKLNITHSKSKPCTPRRPATPGRGGRWGRRSERPLREYMVMKSEMKILSTPDPKRFHRTLEGGALETQKTPDNDLRLASDKLLASLHTLYLESPDNRS